MISVMASGDGQRYRTLIDRLVRACREGQGQIPAGRALRGVWNSNAITQPEEMPDQQRMNVVLAAINEADREVLAQMLYDARSAAACMRRSSSSTRKAFRRSMTDTRELPSTIYRPPQGWPWPVDQ